MMETLERNGDRDDYIQGGIAEALRYANSAGVGFDVVDVTPQVGYETPYGRRKLGPSMGFVALRYPDIPISRN